MTADVLTDRQLNRATLARQLLLERVDRPIIETVEHLVGMQAQEPLNPYLGLWSRVDPFDPDALGSLLIDRKVVRIVVMRGTIHLVSADDCLLLRPLFQPVLDRELERHSEHKSHLVDVDIARVMAFAGPLVADHPMTGTELRTALAVEFPEYDAAAIAYACRNHLAFVQVPPRGVWRKSGAVRSTTAETWLGRPLVKNPSIDDVMLRYLAAFGPASSADMSTWTRLTGLKEVVDRLRPKLRVFRDERGRELLDVPDGPRPDPDVPAPTRFLPEYDNVLLSHSDRSRFLTDKHQGPILTVERTIKGTVLYDGCVRATWRVEREKGSDKAVLVIDHTSPLSKKAQSSIGAEGRRMVRFNEAGVSEVDVRFVSLD